MSPKSHHRRPISAKRRFERQILLMLTFFSISSGLWMNFRQLWLQENGYSVADISTLTSVATFLSVGGIILVGWRLKPTALRSFMTGSLALRLINSLFQLALNGSGQTALIDLCTVIEIFTNYLIVASVYPLITTVIKSNRVYSKRKLVEYLFRDVGVLIGGLLLGKNLVGLGVDYNICLYVSMLFLGVALLLMWRLRPPAAETTSTVRPSEVKHLFHNRLQSLYLLYSFLSSTSFATALGLKMLILTNQLAFSASTATNYLLIAGLAGDVIGMIALKYFTPHNDYLTITLKFGVRLIAFLVAIFADDPFVFLLAITWTLLSETAYEDVIDGNYINLVDNRYQLSYNTAKYVMTYLGEAVGILFCGWMYDFGLSGILTCAACIMVFQIAIAYYLIHLRRRRRRTRHTASRLRYDERLSDEP